MTGANDRQAPIVDAIRAALLADPTLATLIGQRVYDTPPARAVMPSVTIRTVTALDASAADTDAQVLTIDLDVWDRYKVGANLDRPRSIMARIRNILHMQNVPAAATAMVLCRCTGAQGPFRDPDEVALHGIVTLAVLAGFDTALP